jgi:hypothetical protein
VPVLNVNRDLAVAWFLSACDGPDETLAARPVWEFIRYALWSHSNRLEPLLRRMAESSNPTVATAGTTGLTLGWLGEKFPREVIAAYPWGTPAQRKGVARAAAHNLDEANLATRCGELLAALIDDPDDGVREQAGEFLHRPNVLRSPAGHQLVARFAVSREFGRQSFWLVQALRRHPDSLAPLTPIFEAVCGRLAADYSDRNRRADSRDGFALDEFMPLILRLYEQAEQIRDSRVRNACLDWWDRLLEARMGGVVQILGDLDASAAADT